jgi:hypothetical protein
LSLLPLYLPLLLHHLEYLVYYYQQIIIFSFYSLFLWL